MVANAEAIGENRPDSCTGQPQVGWLSGHGVVKGQLSCCDAVKGTFFSAVAVDHAFDPAVHPCRVNLFEKPYPRLWTTQEHRDLIIDNFIK